MKKILWIVLVSTAVFVRAQERDPLAEKLQKGLFEEEANHNLSAAIELYKSVITKMDEERKLAATALFRLGESYRKLGRTNEADAAYARVLRDFSDQNELVQQAAAHLSQGQLASAQGASSAKTNDFSALAHLLDTSPDLLNAPFTNSMTLLQNAAARGDLDAMRYLVQRGAAIDGDPQSGAGPPLYLAAEMGNRAAVEFLIEKGAKVNAHALNGGATALHAAAERGYIQISQLLLDKGADVNARDVQNRTPLQRAAANGHPDEIALLAKHGATLGAADAQGGTPLSQAIRADQAGAIAALIKAGVDPNKPDARGELPVFEALLGNRSDAKRVQTLLDDGANPNAQDPNSGQTALDISVIRHMNEGAPAVFQMLLSRKANPNIKDKNGETALHHALASNFNLLDVTQALIEHGADPNIQDKDGRTPLHYAAGARPMEAPGFNRQPFNDPEIKPTAESTMRFGLQVKEPEIELLLKNEADPNLADKDGRTPLFYATYANSAEAIEALLKAKADPNAHDKLGRTPLDFAPVTPSFRTLPNNTQSPNQNSVFTVLKTAGGTNTLPVAREYGIQELRTPSYHTKPARPARNDTSTSTNPPPATKPAFDK